MSRQWSRGRLGFVWKIFMQTLRIVYIQFHTGQTTDQYKDWDHGTTTKIRIFSTLRRKTCLGGQSQASDSSAPGKREFLVGVQSAGSHGIFLFWGFVYNFNFRYLVWLLGRIMNLESMYQKNETIVTADNQQPVITNVTKRFPLWAPPVYPCFRRVTTSHAWPCHRQKRSDEKTRRLNRCSSFSALAVG